MPTILLSTTSPYSAKVRMCAVHSGFAFEAKLTDTSKPNAELAAANPLGKIPVLLSDNDGAVFDSRVILRYINRATGGKLLPKNAVKLLEAERMEAMADGICDCAVAYQYEKRQRPEDKQYQPWLDKQWGKITGALAVLEANPPKLPSRIHAGHIAMASALGYLTLRFPGWEKGHPKLKRYMKKFATNHADLAAFLPRMP